MTWRTTYIEVQCLLISAQRLFLTSLRANAQYEGLYLLGTSIARPLIAKRQIEIAKEVSQSVPPSCVSDLMDGRKQE